MFDFNDGACITVDNPEIFFPDPTDADTIALAVAVCASCPLKPECLASALGMEADGSRWKRHGIWGGTTPDQRAALHRKTARRSAPARAKGATL